MRRRYLAALVVFVPIVVVSILKIFFPLSYDLLGGYMVVVALMFKSALLSFWAASKLKIIAYIKGLTLIQGTALIIKRWFLDNIFARWLKRNVLDHIMVGIKEFSGYFSALNLKSKFKNIFLPTIISAIVVIFLYLSGNLSHILLFTELKVLVISFSKTILLIIGKAIGFIVNSWAAPIFEVFALSYFLSWLERKLGRDNWLIRTLDYLGMQLNKVFFFVANINRQYVDPVLNDRVSDGSRQVSTMLTRYVHRKKIEYEYDQFEVLERQLLKGHIDAYHHFDGMEKIKDKKELYRLINRRTNDNLDIVAFISRDSNGELVPDDVDDSYYHDIFLLEGLASSSVFGVGINQASDPDASDFWVLNTSRYPFVLCSKSDNFPNTYLGPNTVELIKTSRMPDYTSGDIYGRYNNTAEDVIGIDDINTSPDDHT